jgi:ribosomal protein S17
MSHKTAAVTVPLKSPRRVGVVESDKRLKTRTVVVNFVTKHPKY